MFKRQGCDCDNASFRVCPCESMCEDVSELPQPVVADSVWHTLPLPGCSPLAGNSWGGGGGREMRGGGGVEVEGMGREEEGEDGVTCLVLGSCAPPSTQFLPWLTQSVVVNLRCFL